MCCIWGMAIETPSLLPLYVPFEHYEKFGILLGPLPPFGTMSHISVFFKASLTQHKEQFMVITGL